MTCPNVYRNLTTQHILVMEYVEGVRIDDSTGCGRAAPTSRLLGRRLGENYVKQIIEDGFFHADPHPVT